MIVKLRNWHFMRESGFSALSPQEPFMRDRFRDAAEEMPEMKRAGANEAPIQPHGFSF
jgi:hypothetical protein